MNGSFVGYSQVSHSTSEFDVTDFLKDGTNTIAVLVLSNTIQKQKVWEHLPETTLTISWPL